MRYLHFNFSKMNFLTFIITYPFIWFLSRLPMRILYIFSDFFFLILYYIIGYRKKVATKNLKTAFPNKKETEINRISKKFFKHFVDILFESVKSFAISKNELQKRYKYVNPELINEYARQGRSIALVGSHQANWEWAVGMPLSVDINCFGAYKKIKNPYFDKLIKGSRTKFGFEAVPTSLFNRSLYEKHSNKIQYLYLLLSDQSPQIRKTRYWATFLNEKVPVHTGAEVLAKKYNSVVVNMKTTKIKRGYFEIEFELITDSPNDFDNFEITDKYLAITEKNIKAQPEYYLWTHNRFKHKNKYEQWLEIKKASQK
ncbi:lysophospholipid acyltransferase family protein [Tenacibaculum sp. 47A_GOM-205m]|uniref:lysophospholipid acyltransferase family protein n=1 Tax=Tenacibaculum sp. 47A_GOM-205m TaxID=1380384 RepID=UPI00350EA03D